MNIQSIIAEHIRELLVMKHMTQKDLAEKMQVTQPTVSSWVNATKMPKEETLERIAAALDVTVDYLITPYKPVQMEKFKANVRIIDEAIWPEEPTETITYNMEDILKQECKFLGVKLTQEEKQKLAEQLYDMVKERIIFGVIFPKK